MKTKNLDEIIGQSIFNFLIGVFNFFKTIFWGFKKLNEKNSIVWLLIFSLAGFLLFTNKEQLWVFIPEGNERISALRYLFYLTPLLPVLYLWSKGQKHMNYLNSFDSIFRQIGLFTLAKKRDAGGRWTDVKVYPKLKSILEQDGIKTYVFLSDMPLGDWVDKCKMLESAFDFNVLKIENDKRTKKIVKIKTVPTAKIIPEFAKWKDEYTSPEDFEMVIGENMLKQIKFNLNATPHVLVAGETGSGKSVILRLMLWQAARKGAKIIMIDFKGGVEFGKKYEKFGEVITEKERALERLKELTLENGERLKLFREMEVKNLGEYNKISHQKLSRIMVFCDELAEIMDKSGAGKDEKIILTQIEKELSSLARLSRATGINLVLGMQRPDAKVLPGQIKNNIPVRICGRFADRPASEIVLGNARATELPETNGRFLYKVGADTLEFQAYKYDDNYMKSEDYKLIGGMLTIEEKEQEHGLEDKKRILDRLGNEENELKKDLRKAKHEKIEIEELEGF
jgi:S-DNA-T family DNA segregation ATPase FtsK/SpoIIIE